MMMKIKKVGKCEKVSEKILVTRKHIFIYDNFRFCKAFEVFEEISNLENSGLSFFFNVLFNEIFIVLMTVLNFIVS